MYSSRLHWDLQRNRLTELLAAKRGQGARILDLTQSNPTRAEIEYPEELRRVFDDPGLLRYDPLPAGSLAAREAVAGYYRQRGHAVEPGRILLTASTSEAYSYLFKLLADPGDQVLVARPSYPLFEYLARMESLEVRQYPLEYHGGWAIDTGALARAITARTRAGVEDCAAFAMSGLSKIAGLPQMKLGWIVVAGPARLRAEAIEKLEWIADTYLSVGTPVQCAAPRLLEYGAAVQRQIRERTAANLAFAQQALAGTALEILAVEGGWSITIRVPRVRTEEEWCLELLDRDNVLVQPGYFYDFESEAFLVASLLTAPAEFQEGLARIVKQAARTP